MDLWSSGAKVKNNYQLIDNLQLIIDNLSCWGDMDLFEGINQVMWWFLCGGSLCGRDELWGYWVVTLGLLSGYWMVPLRLLINDSLLLGYYGASF